MLIELLSACFFIFIAEMGDKTQILAMTFATKYSAKKVLLGVMIGSLLNHAIAVYLGFYLSKSISLTILQLIAACSFIFFGLWSLVVDEEDENCNATDKYGPIATVAVAFFIGELGDKTQLTAVALSTQSNFPYMILMGTVMGMILTSGIGILIGSKIGKRIPELALKLISSAIFLAFGIIKLMQSIPSKYISIYSIMTFGGIFLVVLIFLLRSFINKVKHGNTRLKNTAHLLYLNTLRIQASLEKFCTDATRCDNCTNQKCTFHLLNHILQDALEKEQYILDKPVEFPSQDIVIYDKNQLKESLKIAIDTCLHCPMHQKRCIGNIAREVLEQHYFGKTIPFTGDALAYKKEVEKIEKDFFNDSI